jgi:trigger factor
MSVSSGAKRELNVEVEIKELDGGRVELAVRVPPEPVAQVREEVLKGFGRRADIPGFRKGKAPRSVLERFIDQDALRERIAESLLDDAYDAALEKAGLEALGRGQVGDAELAEDGSLTFSATVTRRPQIELGEYKGLKATRRVVPVTEEQIDTEIERMRGRRSEYRELPEDGVIEKGDLAIVDYEMLVDGEKRDEGSAAGYPLEVGADTLFPEMNEALPGARIGEMREVEVSYPETHSDKSLAGKKAVFKVAIREARRRQLPEVTDEFAKKVWDVETVAELRDQVRQILESISKRMADDEVRDEVLRQVADAARLDVPQAIVDREVDARIDDVEEDLERRGLTLTQYLRNTGQTFEDWRASVEVEARQAARRALVLNEIGEREKIEVSDEDVHEEMHRVAEIEGIKEDDIHDRYRDQADINRLVTRVYNRKIIQFLVDSAEVTEEVTETEAAAETD